MFRLAQTLVFLGLSLNRLAERLHRPIAAISQFSAVRHLELARRLGSHASLLGAGDCSIRATVSTVAN